jgi:hypothetical protein
MTQAIAHKSLYDSDFLLWTQDTITKLRVRDFDHVDLDNLIEEIESLGKSDKKEILNRLATLLEHLLKRMYVDLPDCFNGWENTIAEQRRQIKRSLKLSPSLAPYFAEIFDYAFEDALHEVRREEGYKSINFPDTWQFSRDLDSMLNVDFWVDKTLLGLEIRCQP